jgi:hypothetical protein
MAVTPPNVRPGDIISSDLVNYLLSRIGEFDDRISKLETGTQTSGQVEIDQFEPSVQQNVGQLLTIHGKNFAFPPTDNVVTLGNVAITAFEPDSTGSMLRFFIPRTVNVGSGSDGANVKITITNNSGTTAALYRILPGVPVVGNPPQITDVQPVAGPGSIFVNTQIRIIGSNFAADPTQNQITFQIVTASGPVIYPKSGQALVLDVANSNTSAIIVTLPDMAEVASGPGGAKVVTVRVTVGAFPPASRNFTANR